MKRNPMSHWNFIYNTTVPSKTFLNDKSNNTIIITLVGSLFLNSKYSPGLLLLAFYGVDAFVLSRFFWYYYNVVREILMCFYIFLKN